MIANGYAYCFVIPLDLTHRFKDILVGYQFSGFNHHEWLQNGNICVAYTNNEMEAAVVK